MRDFIRTALICLLLVAVPLQGLAAGAMLFCGPVQGSDAAFIEHSHADQGTSPVHHHHPVRDSASSAGPHDAVGHDDPSLQPLGHLHDGTCSVCASCCSGAALPQSASMLHAFLAEQRAPGVTSSQPDPGHAFPGPERPPRRLLA